MAEDKEQAAPKPPEGEAPPADAQQKGGAPSGPSIDEQVEQALGRLADSGRLFGSQDPPTSSPAPSSEAPSPGLDLEGAISRVLDRRESERKTTDERQQLLDKVSQLEKSTAGRVKRWWEPWSPWS